MAKKEKLSLEELLEQALVKYEDKPYEVPGNWVWVRWSYVGKFIAGNGFKPELQGFLQYNIPYFKVGSLRNSTQEGYLLDRINTINTEMLKILKATVIPVDSIIFAKIGEAIRLNRRCLNAEVCCIDNNLMAFVPNETVNYKFTYYWSYTQDLYKLANATTVPAIRKSDLENIRFPLPPIPEQQRIVAVIESLFAKLDRAKELAQNALDSFENRKSAIMHKAFTGELTRKWREENGGIFDNDWEEKKLKDICSKITDGTHKSPKNFDTGEYMYITAKNIKEYGLNLKNITYISEEIHKEIYRRCNVEYGDVLYIKDGATTGIATVNTLKEEFSLLSSVALLKPINQIIDSKYLAYNLNSYETKSKMLSNMTGSAITRLTLNKIQQSAIQIPSLTEQQEIVRILDNLLENEQKAKELCGVIDKIAHMKKSIMARAFRGELGTNKPEEESALELLKEVLKEKAQ